MHSPQSDRPGSERRGDQGAAHRQSGTRATLGDRTGVCRRRRTGRRAQGSHQPHRSASLRRQFQSAGYAGPVPGRVPGWPGAILLSRYPSHGDRVRPRDRDSTGALPRHPRSGARRSWSVQHRAARPLRRKHGHPRTEGRHHVVRAGVRRRRAAVVGRFARRSRQRRSQSDRTRNCIQGTVTDRRRDQGEIPRVATHRDADTLDHDGRRPGPECGAGNPAR